MVAFRGMVFWFRDDGGHLHGDRAWSMQPSCPTQDEMWLKLAKGMGNWKGPATGLVFT